MGVLANKLRPKRFEDVVGNEPVLRILSRDKTRKSTVLWGPAGCGKTTIALIYAGGYSREVDAASVTAADLRSALYNNRCVIINELQRLDKSKQQILLAPIEEGNCCVIGTTTESPSSILVEGLLSRFRCLRVDKPSSAELTQYIIVIAAKMGLQIDPKVAALIAVDSLGVRDALDSLEDLVAASDGDVLTRELYETLYNRKVTENSVESLKSALQKSIRGSDPDAACAYAYALLNAGEINILCRRLRVIACEDIGLAEPTAVATVNACIDSALKLGMPEAAYPVLEAVIYLATLPKSNSVGKAISACKDIVSLVVPNHIASPHPKDYLYPHEYPNHWVDQEYMTVPMEIYTPGDNKREQAFAAYWRNVKKGDGGIS